MSQHSAETSTFTSPSDGRELGTYTWGGHLEQPRGVVQVAHGLSEHAARYDRFAKSLVEAGFVVVAADHRGHGRSVDDTHPLGAFDFPTMVEDIAAFGAASSANHPGLPVVLFAHSMGSFAAQAVVLDHADAYAALVLSGSSAVDVLAAGMVEAAAEGAPQGLEAFNAAFEHRTGFEWLSRDEAEVDAYVADPLSGHDATEESMTSMFMLTPRLSDDAARAGVRSDLPVLIASGTDDPLAGGGALLELLAQRYRDAGLTDVTVTLYPGARHEILNETNRDEVTSDVVRWISTHV